MDIQSIETLKNVRLNHNYNTEYVVVNPIKRIKKFEFVNLSTIFVTILHYEFYFTVQINIYDETLVSFVMCIIG